MDWYPQAPSIAEQVCCRHLFFGKTIHLFSKVFSCQNDNMCQCLLSCLFVVYLVVHTYVKMYILNDLYIPYCTYCRYCTYGTLCAVHAVHAVNSMRSVHVLCHTVPYCTFYWEE